MHEVTVAAEQGGVFSRAQVRDSGITRKTVRARLARGDWSQVLPDVFAVRGTPRTPLSLAWAAHLATGGVVSHAAAASLHRLGEVAMTGLHVISPPRRHVRVAGVVEHRIRLWPDEIVRFGRLPVTTRERTIVDLLAAMSRGDAATLTFRVVQQGWLDESRLRAQIRRRSGMDGNAQLRVLADMLGTGAHSVAERALHGILSGIGGLEFASNARVVTVDGTYVVDVLIARRGVVIEVDGRRFHADPLTFARDRRRQNALVNAGYVVLRFTWLDLVERPDTVRSTVERAVAA